MIERREGSEHPGRRQLQIWDDEVEAPLGLVSDGDVEWELFVVIEPVLQDLYRGRLSFRLGEDRFDTAAILVEESSERVIERAGELPGSVLRQLLGSARN